MRIKINKTCKGIITKFKIYTLHKCLVGYDDHLLLHCKYVCFSGAKDTLRPGCGLCCTLYSPHHYTKQTVCEHGLWSWILCSTS